MNELEDDDECMWHRGNYGLDVEYRCKLSASLSMSVYLDVNRLLPHLYIVHTVRNIPNAAIANAPASLTNQG